MNSSRDVHGDPSLIRDVVAGSTGAVILVPEMLTLGLLAFAPLGSAAPEVAVLAAFITATLGSFVHASLSRTPKPSSGPSSPTVVTLAALVAQLVAAPPSATAPAASLTGIVALCGLAVLLSGVVQITFAWLGLARLARLVPQPVLAGFTNSVALLMVLGQVPLLLGQPPGSHGPGEWHAVHPVAVVLGLATALFIWWVARRWQRLPAALLGLLAGTAVHAAWTALEGGMSAGARIGALPTAWPWPPALMPLLTSGDVLALLRAHAGVVVLTALALAAIGALESSFNVRAMEQLFNGRHDPRREMMALGCGNLVCGLLGGLPLMATFEPAGHGRRAMLAGPVVLALLYVLGKPVLAWLPLPVLGGVMLVAAVALVDRWTLRLLQRWWAGDRSRDMLLGLGVVALVVGTTAWKGMPAGVGLGVLLSLVAFVSRMRRSPVHDRYDAAARPSRRIYPLPVEARLRPLREGIRVLELEGALFFGNSDQLLDEAERLGPTCRCLVLDLARVNSIDESGAVALQQVSARLEARGVHVALAGIADGSAAAQAVHRFGASVTQWPDADRATEAAEQRLLVDDGDPGDVRAMAPVPLADAALLAGLDGTQAAVVMAQLASRHLQAGEALFAEGDAGDCLYIVSQGSISVLSRPDKHGRTQRYLSVSPGMTIGETAMLDGGGRTAGAVADAPTVVHALTLASLEAIGRSDPAVAVRLHRNLALHLSQRLRSAAEAWRSGRH